METTLTDLDAAGTLVAVTGSVQRRRLEEVAELELLPHGLAFLVDHTGTRPIDPEHARIIIEAPAGSTSTPRPADGGRPSRE